MKASPAFRSPSTTSSTMIARCVGLQRAVPSLLRTVHCPPHIAAARCPSARRYAVITNVATPEAPQKPQKDASQHNASFASSAGLAASKAVPYTQLSIGERLIPCRAGPKPSRLGSPSDLAAPATRNRAVAAQRPPAGAAGSNRSVLTKPNRAAHLPAGIPRETYENERRVALTPQGVAALKKAGFKEVVVEAGAGAAANFSVRRAAATEALRARPHPALALVAGGT